MGLFKSFDRLQPEQIDDKSIVTTPLFLSSTTRFDLLCTTIKNIDDKSDDEIKYLIYQEHNNILNYDLFLVHNDTRKIAQNLFKNVRFLKLFLSVINYVPFNRHEIICLNKLAYDYYLLNTEDKDDDVTNLLLSISYEINKKQVLQLSAILGINKARVLALIGNSSFKEERCFKKICTYLIKLVNYPDYMEFTQQNIVDILLIFIDVHFTNVFIAIMTEVESPQLNDAEEHVFNLITCAIFAILESMTSNDIRKVLLEYGNYLNLKSPNKRIKIHNVKHSDRVKEIIEEIELVYPEIKVLW